LDSETPLGVSDGVGGDSVIQEFVEMLCQGGSDAKAVDDIGKVKFVKNLW
jgi:hypothetical protein